MISVLLFWPVSQLSFYCLWPQKKKCQADGLIRLVVDIILMVLYLCGLNNPHFFYYEKETNQETTGFNQVAGRFESGPFKEGRTGEPDA